MLRRTRKGSIPDVGRLSAAVSRPGIDPRLWVSLAHARGELVLDAEHGAFLDVTLLPSNLEVTVRVPQSYAGAAFGEHEGEIHLDDEVLVAFPEGDPAAGGVLLGRFWSAADKPPADAVTNPGDHVRVMEADKSERLRLQGSGRWVFDGEDEVQHTTTAKATYKASTFVADTGNVRLGDENAVEQLVLGTTYRASENAFHVSFEAQHTALGTAAGVVGGAMAAAGAAMASAAALHLIPIAGPIIGSPFLAAAGAALTAGGTAHAATTAQHVALNAAALAFDPSPTHTPYLSDVSKSR